MKKYSSSRKTQQKKNTNGSNKKKTLKRKQNIIHIKNMENTNASVEEAQPVNPELELEQEEYEFVETDQYQHQRLMPPVSVNSAVLVDDDILESMAEPAKPIKGNINDVENNSGYNETDCTYQMGRESAHANHVNQLRQLRIDEYMRRQQIMKMQRSWQQPAADAIVMPPAVHLPLPIIGLPNFGATCYMNSIMQILAVTQPLCKYLLSSAPVPAASILNDQSQPEDKKQARHRHIEMFRCASRLITMISDATKLSMAQPDQQYGAMSRSMGDFHAYLKMDSRGGGYSFHNLNEQQDASEFLVYLVDVFHKALARNVEININNRPENEIMAIDRAILTCYRKYSETYKNDYSDMIPMFHGMQMSCVYSKQEDGKCGNMITCTAEPFFVIDVCISNKAIERSRHNGGVIPLVDCLAEHYGGLEEIEGYHNETTGQKETVLRKFMINTVGQVLCVAIKKYDMFGRKHQVLVDFPKVLDVAPYMVHYQQYVENNRYFDLYAVCNHEGNLACGGHYHSFVKKGDDWFLANDQQIALLVKDCNLVTMNAYILFYVRRGN